MNTDIAVLAEAICVCTANHDPSRRIECAYALAAAEKVALTGWRSPADAEHGLNLLRAVVSYDNANQSDLPLALLDSIRAEVGGPR